VLVGNKGDLEEKRAVPEPDATAYARDAGFEAVQVAASASSKLYKRLQAPPCAVATTVSEHASSPAGLCQERRGRAGAVCQGRGARCRRGKGAARARGERGGARVAGGAGEGRGGRARSCAELHGRQLPRLRGSRGRGARRAAGASAGPRWMLCIARFVKFRGDSGPCSRARRWSRVRPPPGHSPHDASAGTCAQLPGPRPKTTPAGAGPNGCAQPFAAPAAPAGSLPAPASTRGACGASLTPY
jgi:hypothetical protein